MNLEKLAREIAMCKSPNVDKWLVPIVDLEGMIALIQRQESELAKAHDENEALKDALADSVIAPSKTVDCEEFHLLAMDYRGAPVTAEGNWPQVAYEKLVACADQHTARAVAAAVAPLNRANLELTRVNAEQRLQEQRLELALKRAAAPQQHTLVGYMTPESIQFLRDTMAGKNAISPDGDGDWTWTGCCANPAGAGSGMVAVYTCAAPQQHAQAALSIGAHQPFELAAKALHQDWTPEKVHHLINVVDQFIAASHQPAAAPAAQSIVIGFPDPNAVFAAFCDREGYPSDSDMDEPLRKAFWEAVRMFSGDIPAPAQPKVGS